MADLVDRLARIVHGIQFTSGLNPAQWEALRFVARANRNSRNPKALAKFLGVTKGTIGGLLAADMAAGEDNPLIVEMESLGSPDKLPPRPFLDLGVRAKFAWEIFRARKEA